MNAVESESGAAGAAASTPGTAAPGSTAPAASAPTSVMEQAKAAATAAGTATSGNPFDWVPEKHRVNKEGGQELDIEASARKMADSYRALEKRLGSGDVAPKSADEYSVSELPDGITWDEIKNDPTMSAFIKGAHAKGLTNAQLEWTLTEYLGNVKAAMTAEYQGSVEQNLSALRETWKDEAAFQKNLGNAYRAAQQFSEGDDQAVIGELADKYPAIVRLLAKIGGELQEDTSTPNTQTTTEDWESQVAEVRASDAYNNALHPQHKQAMAKMDQLYSKRYGTKPQYTGGGKSFSLT